MVCRLGEASQSNLEVCMAANVQSESKAGGRQSWHQAN